MEKPSWIFLYLLELPVPWLGVMSCVCELSTDLSLVGEKAGIHIQHLGVMEYMGGIAGQRVLISPQNSIYRSPAVDECLYLQSEVYRLPFNTV